ncbi:RNA polymerase subunit sigma, partial [Bacillus cereus]
MFKIKKEERPVSDVTFEDLFKQNYVYVVKQIVWIVKNQTIAEELAQEVFLQLYRNNWKEIENLSGWLLKSSTFVAYKYLRSEKRHQA